MRGGARAFAALTALLLAAVMILPAHREARAATVENGIVGATEKVEAYDYSYPTVKRYLIARQYDRISFSEQSAGVRSMQLDHRAFFALDEQGKVYMGDTGGNDYEFTQATGTYTDVAFENNDVVLLDESGRIHWWQRYPKASNPNDPMNPKYAIWTDMTGKNGFPDPTGVKSVALAAKADLDGQFKSVGNLKFAYTDASGVHLYMGTGNLTLLQWMKTYEFSGDYTQVRLSAYAIQTGDYVSIMALDSKGSLHLWNDIAGYQNTTPNSPGSVFDEQPAPYVRFSYTTPSEATNSLRSQGSVAGIREDGTLDLFDIDGSIKRTIKPPVAKARDVYIQGRWSHYDGSGGSYWIGDQSNNLFVLAGTIPASTHTLTFDSNGGTAIESQTVKDGDTPVKPADPTRDGFTFDGWYTDDDSFNNEFDFTKPLTADVTVYAKWTESSVAAACVPVTGAPVSDWIWPASGFAIGLTGLAIGMMLRRRRRA